jgi:hypothetical protein
LDRSVSLYREPHASWVFIDKNGFHGAYDNDNEVGMIISWENVVTIRFGEGILSDKNINTMFVDLMNGGYITLP